MLILSLETIAMLLELQSSDCPEIHEKQRENAQTNPDKSKHIRTVSHSNQQLIDEGHAVRMAE